MNAPRSRSYEVRQLRSQRAVGFTLNEIDSIWLADVIVLARGRASE